MYDELVKRLRSVKDSWQTEEESWMLQAADAIEELSKKVDEWQEEACKWNNEYYHLLDNMSRWIPVTERLPEPFENIFVANKRGKHYDIDKGWWNGTFFDRCAKGPYHNVTHWMPLPEPPEEENHEKK